MPLLVYIQWHSVIRQRAACAAAHTRHKGRRANHRADHPRDARVGGWSICYPTLTELPDGTLAAIWAQIKGSPGELYGDIHVARMVLKK
jgi:hypothetical protein